MKEYKHPVNGRIERVGWKNILWALLFGVFYFMYKGLWKHAAIIFVAVILLGFAAVSDLDVKTMEDVQMETDVIGSLVWIVYAFLVPRILRNHYLDSGWEEVK